MTMRVKPNPAKKVNGKPIKVRDPITMDFIPKGGAAVPSSPYWVRRLRDGDVIAADAEPRMPGATAGSVEDVIAAISELRPGEETHWTKGGKPECAALAAVVGRPVSATERDAAWDEFQKRQEESGGGQKDPDADPDDSDVQTGSEE